MRSLAYLQIWHLAMLALVPLLYAIFQLVSSAQDPSRALVDGAIALAGVLLSIYSALFLVVTGKAAGEAVPSLIQHYRAALGRPLFVGVSSALLTATFGLLAWQLVMYRQVEFLAAGDLEIYLADRPERPERFAFLRARTPTLLRLSLGRHEFAIRDPATAKWVGAASVEVPWLFGQLRTPDLWVEAKGRPNEKLE